MKTIAENDATLLDCLSNLAPESSKSTLRSWIKEGRITVDGSIVKLASAKVFKGQKIALEKKKNIIDGNIHIVYEDKDLVVIEKPEGLLSVSTAFQKIDTAFAILKRHYHPRKVHVVHRLDQETSGIMVFALSHAGFEGLKSLFEKHDIYRAYYAIIQGHLDQNAGSWQSYLYEDALYKVHTTNDPSVGELATTHYQVEKIRNNYSLVKLVLETGKKNQIRVHCLEALCPVVGDKKYGASADPIKRLCLHAAALEFVHPVTSKMMKFASQLPKGFVSLMDL